MKTLLYISLFFGLLSGGEVIAQGTVTATMRVSATIVSGVTLNSVNSIDVDLESGEQSVGSFNFTTPKYLDSQVDIENGIVLRNENGEEIRINSRGNHQANNGKHQVNLITDIKPVNKEQLKGHYQGNLTTTINYL